MSSKYQRHQATPLFIKNRHLLTQEGDGKETFHIELGGVPFDYRPGDSVAIFASHDSELVEKTIEAFGCQAKDNVVNPQTGEPTTLQELFLHHRNLTRVSPQLAARTAASLPEDFTERKAFLDSFEVWDFLQQHPCIVTPQEAAELLLPLLPRFYSIASSQAAQKEEVHLTVASADFESGGKLRRGTASHFLGRVADLYTTPIYATLHPTEEFLLPQDPATPIIMVGPGTGVAPFRAFMQERQQQSAATKNWLFFGEKYRSSHFFYETFWQKLVEEGRLRLDCAFSRDQEDKIYVQHKLLDAKKELWKWLQEGAVFYVCGDATSMAKAVDQALLEICQTEGQLSLQEARLYLRRLKLQKRYLRDVY